MKRRELFVSFLAPSNGHFLHQKCLGRSFPDTLDSSFVRASLDHLVGAGEQRRRNFDAECPGSVQIDEELDLGDLLNWQVGRLVALQNSAGINTSLPVRFRSASSITQQPAGRDELAGVKDRDDRMPDRQCGKLTASAEEERRIGRDHQASRAQLGELRKDPFEIAFAAGSASRFTAGASEFFRQWSALRLLRQLVCQLWPLALYDCTHFIGDMVDVLDIEHVLMEAL